MAAANFISDPRAATPAAAATHPASPAAALADSCRLFEPDALDLALEAMEAGQAVPFMDWSRHDMAAGLADAADQSTTPQTARSSAPAPTSSGGRFSGDKVRPMLAPEREPLGSNISPGRASPVSHGQ